MRALVLSLVLLISISIAASAQLALEYDINQSPAGSYPEWFAELNGNIYFAADDNTHGQELWRYNPTTNETVRLTDLYPFALGSSPSELFAYDGLLYFSAGAGSGRKLVIHDPITEETKFVTSGESIKSPSNFTVYQGEVYFIAEQGFPTYRLFKYNVQTSEIELVLDINPNADDPSISFLTVGGDDLYLSGNDQVNGVQLWKYNKGSNSSERLTNVLPTENGGLFSSITFYQDKIYYQGRNDTDIGDEFFSYDIATGSVELVADLQPGPQGSSPGQFTPFGDQLMFTAGKDYELWSYTPATDEVMKHEVNADDDAFPNIYGVDNGRLIFSAESDIYGRELFAFDPNAQSVALLQDLTPGDGGTRIYDGILYDGQFIFSSFSVETEQELFNYNIASEQYSLAFDINPNTFSSFPNYFAAYQGRLYFRAEDDIYGGELWVYDPVSGTTTILVDFRPGPTNANPANLFVFDDKLFFVLNFPDVGQELGYYDGATDEIVLVEDLRKGPNGSYPDNWTVYDGKLYFNANVAGSDRDLFSWDPATEEVTTISTMTTRDMLVLDDKLYMYGETAESGAELFVYNAQTQEMKLVGDINPGDASSEPNDFISHQGKLFFRAYDPDNSIQMRSYDPANDVLAVHALTSGNSNFSNPIIVADYIYCSASTSSNNIELWRYDATADTFGLVKDINPDGNSRPLELTLFNDKLYFTADHPDFGRELWVHDPQEESTQILADIWAGPSDGNPFELTLFNDKIYFSADNGTQGEEIWSLAACLNAFLSTEPDVDASASGSIDLSVTGGTPPYNFSWSNGSDSEDISNLSAGDYLVTITDQSGCISILEGRIDEATPTRQLENLMIQIFPNPASSLLNISHNGKQILDLGLYNAQGRLILHQAKISANWQIDISTVPSGIYWLKLAGEELAVSQRVVIVK